MRPPFPGDAPPPRFGDSPQGRPAGPQPDLGRFGLTLFLITLTALFAASLNAYVMMWRQSDNTALEVPLLLWFSTAVLIVSGVTAHLAQQAAQRGVAARLRLHMALTGLLGLAFIGLQTPALIELLHNHFAVRGEQVGLYGIAFTLIVLHAAHVIGGMVPITWLTFRALRRRLSAVHHRRVRACAVYWHFLDGIWLVMFGMFLLTG